MKFGLLVIVLASYLFLLVISSSAYGFIEIKKYKVINSPDVCGEKLCSPLDEQKAKKGISIRENKICNNASCSAISKSMSQAIPKKSSHPVLEMHSFSINNQNFILFKGQGWHNLHNVEITIAGRTFETSMKSQTDDRGNLYMPWQIPAEFEGDTCNVFAKDGKHNIEILAEIKTDGSVSSNTAKAHRCTSTKTPINWTGCDLYGKILTKVDLRMAKLRNANLFGVSLENKDLRGADLTNANLKRANLDGTILVGVDLSHSNMIDAKVREADLTNAKMTYANLHRTDFTKSNLSNVDFTGATLAYSNLSFTDLRDANLQNAGTWAANLNHCKNHPICEK